MRSNEKKLDLFADLIEPMGRIIADRRVAEAWAGKDVAGGIKIAIKSHKAEVVEILARIEGADPATYQIDGMALFMRLFNLFNRPDLEGAADLFTSRAQRREGASSGPATEITGDGAL